MLCSFNIFFFLFILLIIINNVNHKYDELMNNYRSEYSLVSNKYFKF